MTVDRADVGESQLFEDLRVVDELLHRVLHALAQLDELRALRKLLDKVRELILGAVVLRIGAEPVEVLAHRADVRGDRHLVVVEDDDQRVIEIPGIVERLVRHAAGQRAVADHGDRVSTILPVRLALLSDAHPERGGDRGGCVPGAEGVVLALLTAEEAGHAAFLAQGAEPVLAARHHLVRVRLVPDVPNNLVLRGVEDIVKGDRELDRSEARAEMAAGLRHGGDKRLADVRGKLDQLLLGEPLHVLRGVDPRENLPLGHRVRLRRMWLDLAIAGCHGAFPWCMDPKGSSGHERRAMDDPAGGRWPRCRGRSGGVGVPGANPQVPITSRTLRRGIRVIGNVSAKYTSARPFLAAGRTPARYRVRSRRGRLRRCRSTHTIGRGPVPSR